MPRNAQGGPKIRLPEPRPWNERDPVIGSIKGDRPYMMEDLARLLQLVSEGVHKDHVVTWPNPGNEITVSTAVRPIASSGLFRQEGPIVHLSTDGKHWLSSRDPVHLIAIFHANVRFIGEILNELTQESMSHPKLLNTARDKYGFGWTTEGPIFSRTKWLQAAGFVDSYSHRVHINASGELLLARLAVYEPEQGDSSPTHLQPPPQAIMDIVSKLDERQDRRSRAGSLYVPGIKKNRGQLDAIRTIVETCASATRDEALIDKSAAIFGTSPASADHFLRSLKLIGLLERVSATEIAATPAGLAWTETGYQIDFARIAHANVWYFGEIIRELELSGRLTFTELLERCTKYSMVGHFPRLNRGGLTARIALLEALGLIVHVSNNFYKATPLGSAFRQSVPCIDPIDQISPDPLDIASGDAAPVLTDTDTASDHQPDSEQIEANRIADRLVRAARQSEKSVELEVAAIEALNFLGLPATHIGGHGEPDGIVRTGPGKLGTVRTVETKSAANGTVPEEQAKPATLAHHREQHDAEATLYIGPAFEPRLLDVLDDDEQVAVVSTTVIAEAVRRQVDTPLTPEELSPLIDPSLHEADRRNHLLARWKAKEDWALCMRGIIEILSREAESPMSDEEFDSFGAGWLDITSIRRSLRDLLNREVSKELIGEILDFLILPQVAIVETIHERYRLRIDRRVIPRHFGYLGRRWLVGNRLFRH